MIAGIFHRLFQLLDHGVGASSRIAHPQVDHVDAGDAASDCFSLLILPNKYGGNRFRRSATGIMRIVCLRTF